jgi:hypothetical protein
MVNLLTSLLLVGAQSLLLQKCIPWTKDGRNRLERDAYLLYIKKEKNRKKKKQDQTKKLFVV